MSVDWCGNLVQYSLKYLRRNVGYVATYFPRYRPKVVSPQY